MENDSFWNELGVEEDNATVTFMGVEDEALEQGEQEPPVIEETQPEPQAPPPADPVLEKLNALEARYAALQASIEAGRQPAQPQQVQPQPQPQQQQFQYNPTRALNDADLLHYHQTVTAQMQAQQQQALQQMHSIRVGYEKQALENTKAALEATHPDIFKYVDKDLVDREFEKRVSNGQFGFDWRQGIEAIYKISKFEDLAKSASELEQARQAKQAKQSKALKAVTPGGAPYQPATTQPVAGNGRGFKAASAGFLADIGLG